MLSTLVALALCAPPLPEQLFSAKLVIEQSAAIASGAPPRCKPGTKCTRSVKMSWKTHDLKQVFLPGGTDKPARLPLPEIRVPNCNAEETVEFLVLYSQDAKGAWKPLPLDVSSGRFTSCDLNYPDLRLALLEAGSWHEERMVAAGPESLWKAEKKALHSDNPWLRSLAVMFLRGHGAADVIDAEWGKAGTAPRKEEEAKAVLPAPAVN